MNIKQFNKEIEALRQIIQAETKPLPSKNKKARVSKAKTNLEFFAKTYFPHYITKEPSKLHKYLYSRLSKIVLESVNTEEGNKEADAAPRGNAKSTITTLVLPLWCIAYKYRKLVLIVSETNTQSTDFVQFIKLELESNERLKQDFPEICGEGAIWQSNTIITNNGVKVRGVGAGQKLRGMRHGATRPDLVIVDDLENDEKVVSPEQRAKLEKWFFRALMKIGSKNTVYIVIGTILHYDSLLSNLLKRAGWKGKKWQSVISFSKSNLWDMWEHIFTNPLMDKEVAEEKADSFFKKNKSKMLKGSVVLWEAQEDYYYLMKMRVTDGYAHFDSEKQNEPINPEDCLFQEEWITYWDEKIDTPLFAVIDPSLGKKSKKADPSAILTGRFKDGIIYLETADIEKRHPDKIIDDILVIHEREKITLAGVESVQFQQFFKDTLEKIAHERNLTLNVQEIPQSQDKTLRIQSLQPWIKNGWIRFKPNMRTLIDQLVKFPMADHDDGPDALEMLKRLIEESNSNPVADVMPEFTEVFV